MTTTKNENKAAMQKATNEAVEKRADPAVWLAKPVGTGDDMVAVVKYIERGLADVSGRAIDGERLAQLGMLLKMAAHKTPQLLGCSRLSTMYALLDLARMKLLPDGEHAALVPYKGECKAIPMYKGMIDIVADECSATVQAFAVFKGEPFEVLLGTEQRIRHVFDITADRSDESVVAAYATFTLPGRRPTFDVMSRQQIEKRMAMSKTAHRDDSPWKLWFEEKCKVTIIKRGAKVLPKVGPRFQAAIEADAREMNGSQSFSAEVGPPIEGAAVATSSNVRGIDALKRKLSPPPPDDGETLGVPLGVPPDLGEQVDKARAEAKAPDSVEHKPASAENGPAILDSQRGQLLDLCDRAGHTTPDARLRFVSSVLGMEVAAIGALSVDEAAKVIDALKAAKAGA